MEHRNLITIQFIYQLSLYWVLVIKVAQGSSTQRLQNQNWNVKKLHFFQVFMGNVLAHCEAHQEIKSLHGTKLGIFSFQLEVISNLSQTTYNLLLKCDRYGCKWYLFHFCVQYKVHLGISSLFFSAPSCPRSHRYEGSVNIFFSLTATKTMFAKVTGLIIYMTVWSAMLLWPGWRNQ